MKHLFTLICLLTFTFTAEIISAQTTISTTSIFSNNNGSGTVTFNLQNTNTAAVILTEIKGVTGTSGTVPVEIWYKTSPVSGTPGVITVANGWTRIDSTSITGVGNTTTTAVQTFFTNIGFTMPGSTTYAFAVFAGGQRYYSIPTTTSTTATTNGGVSIITGYNVSYGGGAPNGTAPTNALRGWIGEITFIAASACTSPPTAGTTTASSTTICSTGNLTIGLSGNSVGLTQTYQLQSSATLTGTYANIGTTQSTSTFSINPIATRYYRVAVTCSTSTVNSTPVLVNVNPAFPAGTYTINSAAPTAGTNFNSFTDAVSAISCGIAGPVIFNVAAGSGPYTAQVTIPQIIGSSSTNTVTFNGNGATISYNASVTGARAGILLDGADHIIIRNLTITSTGTYGFGIQMMNNADSNIISGCTINNPTTSTATNYAGIVISGSATSATTSGSDCDSNRLLNNTINGGYYGITDLGDATLASNNNIIKGNTLSDFYLYGIYLSYNAGSFVDSNDISRAGRSTVTTFYGVYLTTGSLSTVISRNRIHNTNDANTTSTSTLAGIYVLADATLGNENIVVNNLIYNLNGAGIQYGLYNSGAYCRYLHNTISLDDITSTTTAVTRGFYQTGAAAGIEIRNNIFSLRRTGTGAKTVLYFGTATSVIKSDNNDLYLVPNTGSTNDIGFFSSAYSTLPAWRTGALQDSASLAVSPMFSANFTPGNIALDDTGKPAGVMIDITGAPRSTTKPDLGVYEFHIAPPCLAPGGLYETAVTDHTATIGWNAVGFRIGYQYVLSTSPTPPAGGGTAAASPSVALTGLSASTTYYYFVRTVCSDNGIYYSPWVADSFITCTPPPAMLTAAGSAAICQGSSVTLNATTGTGLTYQFLLNNVSISGATNMAYTASAAGNYRVIVSNSACGDTSAAVTISVNPLPAVSVSPSGATSVCAGGSVALTASGAATYSWTPAAGLNATTGTTVTATPAATTTYTVTGTDGNGCENAATKLVTVRPLPAVSITPATSIAICGSGGSVALTATGAATYTWSPAAGLGSTTGSSVTAAPTVSTTYTVTGTDANGCANTASKLVAVSTPPVVSVSPSATTTICSGTSVTLTASGAATYLWSPATGLNVSSGSTVSASPTTTTTYTVTGTDAVGCATSVTKVVNVNASPSTAISPTPATICTGDSVTLTASGAATYSWTPAAGLSATTGATVIATPAATTTYTVTGTNTNGCTNVASRLITVLGRPNVSISAVGPTAICPGVSVNLTASGAVSYSWSPSGSLSSGTGATVTASPAITTVYTVTGTAINGCTNTASRTINVRPLPVSDITPVGYVRICQDDSVTLTATPGYADYKWMIYNTIIATAVNSKLTTNTGGFYTLKVTDSGGCTSTTSTPTVVTVIPRPSPAITSNGATLSAGSGYVTYAWYRNGVPIAGANKSSYTPVQGGLYTVSVTADSNMCIGFSQAYQYTAVGVNGTTATGTLIKLYPNPTHDLLYIDAPVSVDATVRSMDGKTIFQGSDVKEIATREWADGIYQIILYDKNGSFLKTEKLTKVAR